MTLQNKIKADIILATIISFSFIAFLAFGFIFSKSEGTLGSGLVVNFIADYIIYLFPSALVCIYFDLENLYILLLFAGLNILLYCFILIKLLAKKLVSSKRYKPFNLTVITAYVIPSVILVYVIFLIATSE